MDSFFNNILNKMKIPRYYTFSFHILIILFGIASFCTSIVIYVSVKDLYPILESTLSGILVALLSLSLLQMIIGSLGITGIVLYLEKNRKIVHVTAALHLLSMVYQAILLGILCNFKGNQDSITAHFNNLIILYGNEDDDSLVRVTVKYIQTEFQCCGVGNGSADWAKFNYAVVPTSCCIPYRDCDIFFNPQPSNVYKEGCLGKIVEYTRSKMFNIQCVTTIEFVTMFLLGLMFIALTAYYDEDSVTFLKQLYKRGKIKIKTSKKDKSKIKNNQRSK